MFRHQGPEYFGDRDEGDEALAREEEELARRGERSLLYVFRSPFDAETLGLDWEASVTKTARILSLPDATSLPYPTASKRVPAPTDAKPEAESKSKSKTPAKSKSKRKVAAEKDDVDGGYGAKKSKTDGDGVIDGGGIAVVETDHTLTEHAAIAATFFGVLDPESLRMPRVPTAEEMERVLLEVRKKALRDEYGV